MVTSQTLLALGVGLPLLMIGLYAAWMGRRLERLEADRETPDEPGETGDPPEGP